MSEPPRAPGDTGRSGPYPVAATAGLHGSLAVLEDARGSIAMGLVADDVVFICFVGEISQELAAWCARRLVRMLDGGKSFSLFIDAHSPEVSNAAARSEVVRAMLAQKARLRLLVSLVRSPAVTATARMVSGAFGASAIVTADPEEFDQWLTAAAPSAHEIVCYASCIRVAPSVKPPTQLIRSA